MTTTFEIKQFIQSLADDQMFSNRELSKIAPRHIVDKTLSNMAKECSIVRIVPGIYMKNRIDFQLPPFDAVVQFKARVFDRTIMFQHDRTCYLTNGRNSSFKCYGIIVVLRQTTAQRLTIRLAPRNSELTFATQAENSDFHQETLN